MSTASSRIRETAISLLTRMAECPTLPGEWDDLNEALGSPVVTRPKPWPVTVTISGDQHAAYLALVRAVERGVQPVPNCTGTDSFSVPELCELEAISRAFLAVRKANAA